MEDILMKNEIVNLPLVTLKNGQNSVVISDNKSLIGREFLVTSTPTRYRVKELETETLHQIDKEVFENLSKIGFEDDEILELLIFINECFDERNEKVKFSKISQSLKEIFKDCYSPEFFLLTLKRMDIDDIIFLIKSKDPLLVYKEMCANEEDYDE